MSAKVEFILGLSLMVLTLVWTYIAYNAWGIELVAIGLLYGLSLQFLARAAYKTYPNSKVRFWGCVLLLITVFGFVVPEAMKAATAFRFKQEQKHWPLEMRQP